MNDSSALIDCAMMPGNSIGEEGAKALAPVLGKLTQLTKLNLHGE